MPTQPPATLPRTRTVILTADRLGELLIAAALHGIQAGEAGAAVRLTPSGIALQVLTDYQVFTADAILAEITQRVLDEGSYRLDDFHDRITAIRDVRRVAPEAGLAGAMDAVKAIAGPMPKRPAVTA